MAHNPVDATQLLIICFAFCGCASSVGLEPTGHAQRTRKGIDSYTVQTARAQVGTPFRAVANIHESFERANVVSDTQSMSHLMCTNSVLPYVAASLVDFQ